MATTELTRPAASALDYHSLNAMLNLYDAEGRIQFDKDRLAARHYFLQHVNQNTVFFHNLEEKLRYLVEDENPVALLKFWCEGDECRKERAVLTPPLPIQNF